MGDVEKQKAAKFLKERDETTRWLEDVLKTRFEKEFFDSVKDGVVLCKLINLVKPGTIPKILPQPKHQLEQRANLNEFIRGCGVLGVPSTDMVTERDFSDNPKLRDERQIVQCLYAIARQAQAHGAGIKQLGATYYKSVEEQERLKEKKVAEQVEAEKKKAVVDTQNRARLQRRETEKENRRSQKIETAKGKMGSRQSSRSYFNTYRDHDSEIDEADLSKLENSKMLFGMDLEHQLYVEGKFDDALENEVLDWLEQIIHEKIDHIWLHLKSGRVLCKIANVILPGSVKKIHAEKIHLKEMENIQSFLKAAGGIGVSKGELFSVDDLYHANNLQAVLKTLVAISVVTNNNRKRYSHVPMLTIAQKPGRKVDKSKFEKEAPEVDESCQCVLF